jgi:hypothetical protein
VHHEDFGKRYHLSWLDAGRDTKFNWVEARNYCRRFCMDSVSFDTKAEYNAIKDIIREG